MGGLTFLDRVVEALSSARLPCDTEAELQLAVARVLEAEGLLFSREYRLDARNRVDFYAEGGIVVEVKVQGSPKVVHRQVARYCALEEVNAVVLVTRKTVGMPSEINGRPVVVLPVGKAWL